MKWRRNNKSSRNLNTSNSDSPQTSVERLDQIGIKNKRRPSPFVKRGCPKGDSARASDSERVPIWFYIGYTDDLKRRIKQHKRAGDLDLIYYEAYQLEKLARQREKKLKYYGSAWRALRKRIEQSENPAS